MNKVYIPIRMLQGPALEGIIRELLQADKSKPLLDALPDWLRSEIETHGLEGKTLVDVATNYFKKSYEELNAVFLKDLDTWRVSHKNNDVFAVHRSFRSAIYQSLLQLEARPGLTDYDPKKGFLLTYEQMEESYPEQTIDNFIPKRLHIHTEDIDGSKDATCELLTLSLNRLVRAAQASHRTEAAICSYFDVSDIGEITQDQLIQARNPLVRVNTVTHDRIDAIEVFVADEMDNERMLFRLPRLNDTHNEDLLRFVEELTSRFDMAARYYGGSTCYMPLSDVFETMIQHSLTMQSDHLPEFSMFCERVSSFFPDTPQPNWAEATAPVPGL